MLYHSHVVGNSERKRPLSGLESDSTSSLDDLHLDRQSQGRSTSISATTVRPHKGLPNPREDNRQMTILELLIS